jgi:hypothetical protein
LKDYNSEHYCYVCKKGKNAEEKTQKYYSSVLDKLFKEEIDDYEK